ncbi:MAG: hypothetical protein A2W77_09080 [Nitrospinae bacterium RIFCSPLOWO2_12_39_16]|nr:MAG: hypothetical protein A2Z59_13780 [Nitrospinae bacterium RIFCSPLOWO2_02_39_17]OGW08307.1 MAG: hypothetical protein A2W77_09080 [Nitrospinae bacterium RIFCSPLOWO2_12_39_16]
MKTIELKVDGLCCSDCAIKVENVLKATRGVTDIKTLITTGVAILMGEAVPPEFENNNKS